MEHSVPISDLPFNVHAFESRYGKIRSVEKLCPGIFRILTVPIPLDQFICSDLFVVMADSPAIPLTAKAYGIPLESSPEVLVVYCNADYFDKETKKQLYLDIYDDSMWLINLIENMLSVTRLEEGRMNLNISVELVDDVIQEALRHVDRKKDEHTITVEHEDELLLTRKDSSLIVQMVINLVDNAIKYTQKGSHIDIRTGREGKNAVISVADDGPGISDEMKEHIFETFYTGTNKIADSRRSLGLGLALCKSIVNVHGGEIKVSDAHPHGAVFQFTLPAGEVYLYEQTTDIGCGR